MAQARKGCQMVFCHTKYLNFGTFWITLKLIILVYFMSECNILWRFGTFSPFCYVVPRQIWQPWHTLAWKNCLPASYFFLIGHILLHPPSSLPARPLYKGKIAFNLRTLLIMHSIELEYENIFEAQSDNSRLEFLMEIGWLPFPRKWIAAFTNRGTNCQRCVL
jgi:hypothetical protein